MNTNTKRGNELNDRDQRYVLNAYIYRGTVENNREHPAEVRQARGMLPLITDAQWMRITEFNVKADGTLDKKAKHCHTHHMEIPEWEKIIRAKC